MTTVELARRANLSQSYVWQIAHGDRIPSPKVARRIERATGGLVSVMELSFPEREEEPEIQS